MDHYFIAQIKIRDEEEYRKYIEGADEVFSKYNGKYLAVDNHPEIIEGKWDYTRMVIITFNNRSDFESWYYSGEYQEILKYRLGAAICDSVLVEGKSND